MLLEPKDYNPDGIIEDERSLAVKSKVMERLKGKNLLDSIHTMAMFAGTLLTTVGAGMVLPKLLAGAALTVAGLGGAAALGTLAVGLAIIGTAVITDYIASGIGQGANIDIQETAAHSTARHMVREFTANNLSIANEQGKQEPQKNWAAQADAERRQQEATIGRG